MTTKQKSLSQLNRMDNSILLNHTEIQEDYSADGYEVEIGESLDDIGGKKNID